MINSELIVVQVQFEAQTHIFGYRKYLVIRSYIQLMRCQFLSLWFRYCRLHIQAVCMSYASLVWSRFMFCLWTVAILVPQSRHNLWSQQTSVNYNLICLSVLRNWTGSVWGIKMLQQPFKFVPPQPPVNRKVKGQNSKMISQNQSFGISFSLCTCLPVILL